MAYGESYDWEWAAGQTGGAAGTLLLAGEAFGLPAGYMVWYDSNTGNLYALNQQTGAYDYRYLEGRPDLSNWPEGAANPGAANWDFAINAMGQTAQVTGYESVGGEAYAPGAISEDTRARQERTAGYGGTLQDILESGQVAAETGPERVADYRAAGTAGNTPTQWPMLGGITATPNEVQAAIDAALASVPVGGDLIGAVKANLGVPLPPGLPGQPAPTWVTPTGQRTFNGRRRWTPEQQARRQKEAQREISARARQAGSAGGGGGYSTAADIDRSIQRGGIRSNIPGWMRNTPTPRQALRAAGQPTGGWGRISQSGRQRRPTTTAPAPTQTTPRTDQAYLDWEAQYGDAWRQRRGRNWGDEDGNWRGRDGYWGEVPPPPPPPPATAEAAPTAPWLQNLQTGRLAREWEFPMAGQPRYPTAEQWFRMSESERQGLQGSVEEHGGSWPDYSDWMIRSWTPGTEKRLQPQWAW